jgi:hypothetical protein
MEYWSDRGMKKALTAMKLTSVVVLVFFCTPLATRALTAEHDFGSLRKAADDIAKKQAPGFQLLKVELTASHQRRQFQIHDSEFHYFGSIKKLDYKIPGVTTRVGDLELLRVRVRPLEGMHLPKINGEPYTIPIDESAWQMMPVPNKIVSPEDAVRQLNREIPGDPYRRPKPAMSGSRNRTDLFEINLVKIGDASSAKSRQEFKWAGLSMFFGFARPRDEFFARTGPLGKWIWWTRVEQDRPDPASNPRRAGTPRKVLEYIYIDALSGKVESHCHGADSKPIGC